jgi:hypothetical protein
VCEFLAAGLTLKSLRAIAGVYTQFMNFQVVVIAVTGTTLIALKKTLASVHLADVTLEILRAFETFQTVGAFEIGV